MAETKKIITPDQKLKAFALWSMARDHYVKARVFEEALGEMLEMEDSPYCGCISDEMQEERGNFDRGLANEGFEVKAPTKKTARKR